MKRRITDLLTGTFRTGAPRLIVSPDRLDETVSFDEVFRGEINIGTADQTPVRGFVSSDSARVSFIGDGNEFSGNSISIAYDVSLKGIRPGESVNAVITVTTSVGETDIPLHLQVEEETADNLFASYGLKYLDDFAALAKNDYSEAYRLFTDKRFEKLLTGDDARFLSLYRALSQNPVTYQRMEEFLTASGKKEAVVVSLGQTEEGFYRLGETTKEVLRLTKNTWGFLNFRVDVSGDFLEVPKKQITDQDFVGSICDLEYVVHADAVGDRKRRGRITLSSASQTLTFDVTASGGSERSLDKDHAYRTCLLRLKKDYLAYRLGRFDAKVWADKSLMTLTAVREMTEYPVELTLYEAFVFLTSGDRGSAGRLLRSLESHDFTGDSLQVKGAFLYLCHRCELLTPGRIDVVARIREWYQRKQESFVLLYLLMQVDEDLTRTPIKKMRLMEELFERGSNSPFLYIEALNLLKTDGDLLRRLSAFTKQVLFFAVRYDLMTEDLAGRTASLADNEKTFTRKMYRILETAYEKYPSNQILEAVCRLIMKGNPRNPAFFRWYALAVDENIRLTRLYEYYIETMPATYRRILPSPVRKYFLMSQTVGNTRLAQIYANVVRNRDNDEETYLDYIDVMAPFTAQALIDGTINEDYAVLYKECYPTVSDRVVGEALTRVMFTARLYCDDPRAREVVVLHSCLSHEAVTALRGGVSYINLYTPDARIVFQDEKGRRYASGIAYSLEPLMETGRLTSDCLKLGVTDTGLLCHICGGDPSKTAVTPETIGALIKISDSEDFTGAARRAARKKILAYMTDNPLSDSLNPYLREINIGRFARTDKAALLDVLITRGFYDQAYDVISRYGYEKANTALLVRLVSRRIEEREAVAGGEPDDQLMKLAAFVYNRGKYDEKTLAYLVEGYNGAFETMLAIRQSAVDFYLDTFPIDERLLIRSMFIQKPLETSSGILKNYRQMGGNTRVMRAFLSFEAQMYLTGKKDLEPYEAALLGDLFDQEREDISAADSRQAALDGRTAGTPAGEGRITEHLALLRYFAGKDELTLKEEGRVEDLLEEMAARQIRLAFFQKLPDRCLAGYHLKDRIFVEQAAAPGDKVTLFYRLSNRLASPAPDGRAQPGKTTGEGRPQPGKAAGEEGGSGHGMREAAGWIREPLPSVIDGIYSREFVLFYGETLTYYLTIDHDGVITQTPERTKTMPSVDMSGRSRYQLINQMLSAGKLGKTELYDLKDREYRRAAHQAERLFDLE